MANVLEPAEILEIIVDLGTTATFQTLTGKSANTAGVVTETGGSTETGYITPPAPYSKGYNIDKGVIARGMECYLAASGLGFTPTPTWEMIFATKTWKILNADPVYVGDDIGLWRLELSA